MDGTISTPKRTQELSLREFRLLAKLLTWASVAAAVASLYAFLHGAWGLALPPLAASIVLLYAIQRISIRVDPGAADLLVFVTKEQCSLCEEAEALLTTELRTRTFRLERVDVASDRLLFKTFRNRVPVLLWQGEVLAELRWDPKELGARLDEASRRSRAPARPG